MTDEPNGECTHCEQPIVKTSGRWIHARYSTLPNDDLRQCMLYAEPKI